MALDSLAVAADLPERWRADVDADRALLVASAAIRDAACVPISSVTATIVTPAPVGGQILGLPGPLSEVTEVLVDGTAVTDYQNLGNGLWRRCGWACEPVPVTVTATFGLAEVPDDIVDLCCQLAVAWLQHQSEGGGSTAGLKLVRLDDAAEGYSDESAGHVSPVFIPAATRTWLAARFGGGGVVVVELL